MVAQMEAPLSLEKSPVVVTNARSSAGAKILIEAERRLQDDSQWLARSVQCEFQSGILVLRGEVPSYYIKQLTQALLREIEGVEAIVNRLDVIRPAGFASMA